MHLENVYMEKVPNGKSRCHSKRWIFFSLKEFLEGFLLLKSHCYLSIGTFFRDTAHIDLIITYP